MRNDPMGRVETSRRPNVESDIQRAVSAARAMKTEGSQVAVNFERAVKKSVATEPLTTLAMAAAVGFVLGVIWKA